MSKITYTGPDYSRTPVTQDNCEEVKLFIGPQPKCSICGGSGEFETEYGPKGCNPCNSRLISFVNCSGKTVYADWGDTIERRHDGLHKIQ